MFQTETCANGVVVYLMTADGPSGRSREGRGERPAREEQKTEASQGSDDVAAGERGPHSIRWLLHSVGINQQCVSFLVDGAEKRRRRVAVESDEESPHEDGKLPTPLKARLNGKQRQERRRKGHGQEEEEEVQGRQDLARDITTPAASDATRSVQSEEGQPRDDPITPSLSLPSPPMSEEGQRMSGPSPGMSAVSRTRPTDIHKAHRLRRLTVSWYCADGAPAVRASDGQGARAGGQGQGAQRGTTSSLHSYPRVACMFLSSDHSLRKHSG